MQKLWSVKEVAQYLSVGRNTVYELIWQKKLNAKKVGRAYKITQIALDSYLETLNDETISHGRVTIIPPNITDEDNEKNLKAILDYLQVIADSLYEKQSNKS